MHRILPVGLLLLAGCQGIVGPRERRCLTDRIDDPCLTLREQERKERDRLALPDPSPYVGPRTDMEYPGARPTDR